MMASALRGSRIATSVAYVGSRQSIRCCVVSLPPRCRLISSTPSLCAADNKHRKKLHIGFSSLSNTLPFDEPSNNSGKVGDKELDPRASIMLTALRGGVSSFDCPAPPLLEKNTVQSNCWLANRQSEINIGNAFDQAWEALLEEDDGEAIRAMDGSATISMRCGYRAAVVLSEEQANDVKNDIATDDCQEREGKFHGDARVNILFAGR